MADNVIQVVIRARDEASKQIATLRSQFEALAKSGNSFAAVGAKGLSAIEAIGPVGLAAGAGLAVAAAGVVKLTQAAVEGAAAAALYADSLDDVAERAGLTTEEVSRLSFAASQSDTSISAVQTSMRFLSRNLFEARDAASETRSVFLALGFSVEDLDGGLVNAQDALLKMADAIAAVDNPIERTALATKLLGRSADELVPFLARGSAGLRELFQESDRTGATVSTAAGRIGDAFDKATKRFNLAVKGLQVELASGIIPVMTKVVDLYTKFIAALHETVDGMKEFVRLTGSVTPVGIEGLAIRFKDLPAIIVASFPPLKDLIRLLEHIRALAPEKPVKAERFSPATAERAARQAEGEPGLSGSVAFRLKQIEEERKARKAAAEAAKKQAEALRQLRQEFEAVASQAFAVPKDVAERLFKIDPKTAANQVIVLQKIIEDAAKSFKAELPITVEITNAKRLEELQAERDALVKEFGVPVPIEINAESNVEEVEERIKAARRRLELLFGKPLTFRLNTEPIENVKPALDEAAAAATRFLEALDEAGIGAERMIDRLIELKIPFGEMAVLAVTTGDAIKSAFDEALDPFATAIHDTREAVFQFVDGAMEAFDTMFTGILFGGQNVFKSLGDFFLSLRKLVAQLVRDLILAIAKALILKAIGFGIFSGGGTARLLFSAGGVVPRLLAPAGLAGGGSIAHALDVSRSVVRAAGGLTIVPGALQRRDKVPALLAPGEVVLPFINGIQPAEILGKLARLSEIVDRLAQSRPPLAPAQAPLMGAVNIYANDFDSIRYSVRSGAFAEQTRRAFELGR